MTFASLTFVLFLAVVFPAYWALRARRPQNALLLAASYVFYGWWDYRFCGLMAASSLVDYLLGLAIERARGRRWRKALLLASIGVNLGLLGVFKYFDFFAESLKVAAGTLGWRLDPVALGLVLPVGISFYTFQSLGYTIDVYRGHVKAARSVLDFMAYVAFFPQLVAGPIERAGNLLPQFQAPRTFDALAARHGGRLILWGLFKKLAVADRLAAVIDPVYATPGAYGGAELALATVGFALQIYFDFSAYSEIAVGVGRLFGFRLMKNFDNPYFSASLSEFWRRWHVSLSGWFRDYVYIPLGGSRAGRLRHAGALLGTFLLSGLWHGAAWGFLAWGALHGLAMVVLSLRRGRPPLVPRPIAILGTFLFVSASWVFFRAATLADALLIYSRIGAAFLSPAAWAAAWPFLGLAPIALLPLVVEGLQRRREDPLRLPLSTPSRWLVYSCILWATLLLVPSETAPFIYFQF